MALIALERSQRINREITAPEVRLVGVEGEQVGVVPIAEAIRLAEVAEVDLVEIAPMAKPPVCRIMDFGKFRYREQKRAHEAKLKQKQIQVKEVKFRPGTDEGDYAIKMRNLRRFIEEDGDKGKVTLRYRGREITHQDIGMRLLERIRDELADVSVVEHMPKLEGRQMVMVLSPLKKEQRDKIKREAAKKPATPADETAKKPVAAKPAAKPAVKRAVKPEATT